MYPSNTNIDHHPSMIITSNCSNEDHEEDPYSSFYNFPSPYIQYEDGEILLQHLHYLFSQQHQTTTSSSPPPSPPQPPPPPQEDQPPLANGGSMPPALRLTRKCDRHSKIHTAQGTRDRRMRLSIQVARPFFDLQDMLGFDKASKTVDWLLKQSKTAIKELYGGTTDNIYESVPPGNFDHSASDERKKPQMPKGKKNRVGRKFAFDPNAKETREKARARARERTMEKRKLRESRLAKNSLQDGGNVIASICFVERPVSQQLHVSDYDVHGQIW